MQGAPIPIILNPEGNLVSRQRLSYFTADAKTTGSQKAYLSKEQNGEVKTTDITVSYRLTPKRGFFTGL